MPRATPKLIEAAQSVPLLVEDTKSWWTWRSSEPFDFASAFEAQLRFSEFRSLTAYRLRNVTDIKSLMPDLPLATDLYIHTDDIGPGLRIQHGYSTWILAERIGANFHVNQNVTIGMGRKKGVYGKPTIGSNVKICTGAVVAGNITIGDHVVIAPNAFVNFDVPSGKRVFPPRAVMV